MLNTHTAKAVQILKDKKMICGNAKGVLLIKDCVLMEGYTGKTFTYTLYNYNSGEKQYIRHRQTAATPFVLETLLPKLTEQTILGTTIPSGEDLIRFIFRSVFPRYGYAERSEQIDLAVMMFRAIKNREILMSDVAVGFGKTHAYLVAGIVYHLESPRMPIIVTTSSKELQRAIMDDYLPGISTMLLEHGIIDREIQAVLRKGKYNYICDERLTTYLDRLKKETKPPLQYDALRRVKAAREIDLDKAIGISRYDRNRINVSDTVCRTCNRPFCLYRAFMRRVFEENYVFQVCNHNYYTMDARNKSVNQKPLLPEYQAVIIDESHKLNQAAVQTYSTTIDFEQIEAQVKGRKRGNSKIGKQAAHLCKDIEGLCTKIKNAIYGSIEFSEDAQKYSVPVTNAVRSQLLNLSDKLLQANQMQIAPSCQLLHLAKNIMRFLNAEQITYVERVGKKGVLIGVPTEIDKLIKRDLFDGNIGVVMTSGTMAVDNNFTYTKGLLGLNDTTRKLVYVVKLSPFNYMENSLIYTSTHTVYPNYENEIYFKTLAGEVDKLIRVSHGHALVLFTSYRAMRTVYELLRKREYPFQLFKTNKGGGQAITDFRNSDNAVLFGCGPLWEGMNFEGDKLSHLIITKLPFLIPDPITEYKRSQMESEDEYRQNILIPQMLLKLKQGHGRAIRTDTDTAAISILDCRVNTHYRQSIQNALPECRYTSEIEDVAQFFREKKSDEYFGRYANGTIRVN